ncbi:hypothetical protein RM530_18540, partial [Algiphilus sp. W345]
EWHALPDRIYRKTLDLKQVRKSAAYKKTGTSNPYVTLSRYTLRIELVFDEDQLTLNAYNVGTNPLR